MARKLRPYTAELRRFVEGAEPAVTDLARVILRPGPSNDLVELARATPPLRDIAVGPVRRNGEKREGAFPASAEALENATPRVAFARPYSVDFTGWLDDFSHSGNYDALGGFARIGTHVNAFSFKSGVISPIAPALRAQSFKELAHPGPEQPLPRLGRARPRRRLDPVPADARLQLRPAAGAARAMRRLVTSALVVAAVAAAAAGAVAPPAARARRAATRSSWTTPSAWSRAATCAWPA